MNWYKFYVGDFARDTSHLTLTERGAYRALIDHYYATEKPLPANLDALCRIAGAHTKAERDAVKAVLGFFESDGDNLRHGRIETEIAKADQRAETNKAIAEHRERARREARSGGESGNETSTNRATNRSTKPQPIQTPDTRHQTANPPLAPPEPRASRSAEAAQGTRLPANWEPDDAGWKFAAEQLGGAARACITLDSFRDYWTAKPGKDGRKSDWQATWRNWVRRETSTHGIHSASRTGSTPQPRKLSAVEQVRQACGLDEFDRPLVENDPGLRPQVAEQLWPEADGFLEGDFRAVS